MKVSETLKFKRDLAHQINAHSEEFRAMILSGFQPHMLESKLSEETIKTVVAHRGLPSIERSEVIWVGDKVQREFMNRALGPEPKQLGSVDAPPYVPRGLAIFQSPMPLNPEALLMDSERSNYVPITAMSWATGKVPVMAHHGNEPKVIWAEGVVVLLWSSGQLIYESFLREGRNPGRPQFTAYPITFGSAANGGWFIAQSGLHSDDEQTWFYDGDSPETAAESTPVVMAHELWKMLAEELYVMRRVPPNTKQRKMLRRAKMTDSGVSVIELRHVHHMDSSVPEDGDRIVDWSHRWYVRGHPRKITDRKTGETRVVWVKPHIKGPKDKPLHVTEKVYALKR